MWNNLEKIIASETTDKGLISKTYKQLMQFNTRKTTQSKVGRSPKQTFPKMYRWLINTWKDAQHLSLLEKHKSKLQWDIMLHQSEWPSSKSLQTIKNKFFKGYFKKKSTNNKCWKGCGEKRTFLHCWWECKPIQPLWKMVWRFLKKTRNKSTLWPRNLTSKHIPWGNQNW